MGSAARVYMELSKRLQAVAGLVTAGSVLADIGTDHAYIPICLVQNRYTYRGSGNGYKPGTS